MNRKWVVLLIFICIGLLFLPSRVQASEIQDIQVDTVQITAEDEDNQTDKRVIKVGWYECEGYFERDADGNLSGFGVDYLNAIAQYTGWEYYFVKGTRRQCLSWLETGKIDILSPIGKNQELVNAQTAREVIGEDYGYIYKLSNNQNITYGDYAHFPRVTLGIERESGLEENLARYCEENGFNFYDIVTYDTLDEMKADLAETKIDAIVTNSYVNMENLKVVGRFSNGRVTFAVSDDEILTELNEALEEIKLNNPSFAEDLRKLYFSEASQSDLEYTEEEENFLSVPRTYTVALCKDQYPISYKSSTGGDYVGIVQDVLKKIENSTGLSFSLVYVDDYEQGQEMLENREVDILGGCVLSKQGIQKIYDSDEIIDSASGEYTTDFYDVDMAFVGRKSVDMDGVLKVAVPDYFTEGINQLKTLYPSYEIVVYSGDDACFDAVLNGQVDVAVQSDLKINELTVYDQYKELQNLKYIPGNYVASFCVNTDDDLLVGILDKALNSITESTLSTIVNNNIRHIAIQQMSLWDMIQQYKGYIIMAIVLLITLTYTYSSYRKFKEEQRQKDLAYHDSIADIGSMQKFKIDVEPILQGHEKEDYYLLTIDIDKFKVINDLYGYEQGDRVIRFLAGKIKAGLTSEDYVTRNHADNFVVLKHGYSLQEVEIYLEKLFRSVEKTLEERQSHYNMIIKAGIYRLEDEDVNLSGIIDKANMAKENIREGHQSSYQNYAEDMRQKTLYTKKIENQMEEALEQEQFCVYLQPQIDLKTKQIVSAEALVRWIHPEDGIIPPDNFIPIFEKNGFINKLDEFVWEQSIKTVAKWHDQHMIAVPVAINFSRVDVLKEGMVDKLFAMMDKYELDSQWIKTELTESVCLDNDSVVMEKMHMLKNFGLKIAVDDFGSGYSSLHLLKKMPVDILKIDKSFLDFTPGENSRGEIVIRDVVEMGKDLDLQIIIEGVETKEQSDFMESIGCDIVQGYFYGRPMPISDFEQKLRENRMAGGAMA